eukprot:CAMPEP_0176488842 /NCGR_PEP_ID=MMETSP0200_2-20121128/6944_1 /TAXON_ID=947934 /ORGANISM="Chaetoceros sp., Strain GSL56" /LENGTH=64 /DNA_ID=CAMNT_0017885891 /DNA_START=137 /DNA_END=327 /DNA_ORIENTATION=+
MNLSYLLTALSILICAFYNDSVEARNLKGTKSSPQSVKHIKTIKQNSSKSVKTTKPPSTTTKSP